MSIKTRYGDHFHEWEGMTTRVAANLPDVPHLEVPRAKLESVLDQVRALVIQQAALQASKQEISKRLKALMPEGAKLATVLRVGLKQHYGNRSEKLVEFGLQPFRGRPRKAKTTSPAEPPTDPKPVEGS